MFLPVQSCRQKNLVLQRLDSLLKARASPASQIKKMVAADTQALQEAWATTKRQFSLYEEVSAKEKASFAKPEG